MQLIPQVIAGQHALALSLWRAHNACDVIGSVEVLFWGAWGGNLHGTRARAVEAIVCRLK